MPPVPLHAPDERRTVRVVRATNQPIRPAEPTTSLTLGALASLVTRQQPGAVCRVSVIQQIELSLQPRA